MAVEPQRTQISPFAVRIDGVNSREVAQLLLGELGVQARNHEIITDRAPASAPGVNNFATLDRTVYTRRWGDLPLARISRALGTEVYNVEIDPRLVDEIGEPSVRQIRRNLVEAYGDGIKYSPYYQY